MSRRAFVVGFKGLAARVSERTGLDVSPDGIRIRLSRAEQRGEQELRGLRWGGQRIWELAAVDRWIDSQWTSAAPAKH